jgi:hypothetical protein
MKKVKWCNLDLLMYPAEHSVYEDRSMTDPLRDWQNDIGYPNEENVIRRSYSFDDCVTVHR